MAPVSVDQEKQQELQGAAAPVYMQLPGPGPAALPTNNFNVQYTYATYSPPSYPSLADPHSINPYVAAPSCLEYPPQQYPAQQYPASYSPQQYVASSSPQPCAAAPPSAAAGTAVTGYPAVAGYPVQPTAVATTAAAPGQGIPAALPADQAPQGFCTVTTALFLAGFLFPVCWLVCVFLPCCSKHNSPRDKRAATASGVMIAAVVVIVVMKCGLGWNEGAMRRSEYVYYT